jgi:hypothetical protein
MTDAADVTGVIAEDDDEMPEIDFDRCRIIRRGPIGERRLGLAALRGSQGVTQAQLAVEAGLTQGEVSRAESRSDCLVSTLERYAGALGGELILVVRIGGRSYPIALGGGG